MLKPPTLMALDDDVVPAENDLRYAGGVGPIKHAARSSRRDRTAIREAVGVAERRYPDRVFQRTAATRGQAAPAPRRAPRYHRFEYTDRWADSDKARIDASIRQLMAMGYHGDASKDLTRTRTVIDMTKPATQELGKTMPTIAQWFKLIPRAVALDIIYDPDKGRLCNGVVLDEESIRWFQEHRRRHWYPKPCGCPPRAAAAGGRQRGMPRRGVARLRGRPASAGDRSRTSP